MNDLKKIIVEEIQEHNYKLNEINLMFINDDRYLFDRKELEEIADNIISKLPIITSPITEDRIVEVLKGYGLNLIAYEDKSGKSPLNANFCHITIEEIASEILKGQGWEVVARGEVMDTIRDSDNQLIFQFKNIEHMQSNCKGKNIEIAVREVKCP